MPKRHLGFTLIEMILTIVLFSLLLGISSKLLSSGFSAFAVGDSIKTISSQAVMGLERIVYDLRNASSLTTISSNSLTFVDQSGTSYTYSVSNGLLQRGSYTLLDSVQSITFTYLDSSGNSTNTASATKQVKITLNMQNNNVSLAYSTLVGLRGMN